MKNGKIMSSIKIQSILFSLDKQALIRYVSTLNIFTFFGTPLFSVVKSVPDRLRCAKDEKSTNILLLDNTTNSKLVEKCTEIQQKNP